MYVVVAVARINRNVRAISLYAVVAVASANRSIGGGTFNSVIAAEGRNQGIVAVAYGHVARLPSQIAEEHIAAVIHETFARARVGWVKSVLESLSVRRDVFYIPLAELFCAYCHLRQTLFKEARQRVNDRTEDICKHNSVRKFMGNRITEFGSSFVEIVFQSVVVLQVNRKSKLECFTRISPIVITSVSERPAVFRVKRDGDFFYCGGRIIIEAEIVVVTLGNEVK